MKLCRKPEEYYIPIRMDFKDFNVILKTILQQITIMYPLLLFKVSFLYLFFLFESIAKKNHPLIFSNNLSI